MIDLIVVHRAVLIDGLLSLSGRLQQLAVVQTQPNCVVRMRRLLDCLSVCSERALPILRLFGEALDVLAQHFGLRR
ncbi:MAG TPA: hypothetical protein VMF89_17115, partial [Polyangiales bacterium]|nr:hypothetical protein [Polyangiales bacterium]